MPLLETRNLTAFYGDFQALYGIDMMLDKGETVAIIGANGAGKSTFLKAVAGLIRSASDSVLLDGAPIGAKPAAEIVKLGIALVPEGRRLFPSLTVEENLLIGAHGRKMQGPKIIGPWTLDRVYSLFPILKERRSQATPTLSGGQQQMAAIGRALMSNPRILLCDEISLGLAPIIIADVYAALPQIKAEGTSVVLVEQDIVQAMKVSDRVYCFQEGQLSLTGRPRELTRDQIHRAYFGS
jgi:branched-chain amino acid transport system ATP-binding protein